MRQYETILNGVNTWFDVNDRYYYQSEYETDSSSLGGNLLGGGPGRRDGPAW